MIPASQHFRRLSAAAVLCGAGLCTWAVLREDPAPIAAATTETEGSRAAGPDPGTPGTDAVSPLREPVPPSAAALAATEPREPGAGHGTNAETRDPHDDPVAQRIARLEELARSPATFHGLAWRVVEELSEVCADLPAAADDGRERTRGAVLDELMATLVGSPDAAVLVRGAVFLALAPLLSEPAFSATFYEWTSGAASLPLELARVAALAAVRRGEPVPCSSRISLGQLAALPTVGDVALPGVYPMRLDRLAAGPYCEALRRWLDAHDARKERFMPSSTPPSLGSDGAALSEYLVTSEVLFCVWGLQCLIDPAVEAAVVDEALMLYEDQRAPMCLRAASFVVQSLARCSPNLYESSARAAASSNRFVASIARELERAGIGGIGVGLVSRIEELRYSPDVSREAELVKILGELGKSLVRTEGGDTERTFAMGYLEGLVSDVSVSELARASALTAIARAGSWSELQEAARLAVRRADDEMLAAIALNSILARGEEHHELRADALQLLRDLEPSVPAGLRGSVDRYIARLDR